MKNLAKKEIILGLIGYILFVISTILAVYLYFNKEECPIDNSVSLAKVEETPKEENKFKLEVKGEVNKPGVYEVNEGAIIKDVIDLASGFTKNANTNNINLSMKVKNEMVIYVYKKTNKIENKKVSNTCTSNSYDIQDCIKKEESIIIPGESKVENNTDTKKEENTLININTASKDKLQQLSGIGASKADAIIKYREEKGPFKTIDEIKNVSGIGSSTYEKFKNNITV